MQKEVEELRTQAVRIRDLELRIGETNVENERLVAELEKTGAEVRRIENSGADRVAALEAIHMAALAETEKKAQAKIRSLCGQLVEAEASLAKSKKERHGPFTRLLSFSQGSRQAKRDLMKSGLFDAEWYSRQYPDVAKSGRSPAEHFLEEGYLRGYRPNPLFDTHWYLERYEDVRRSGVNPLLQYLVHGYKEGRDPGPEFKTDFYLVANPDVRASGINPLAHYLRYGRYEGRLAAPRDPASSI